MQPDAPTYTVTPSSQPGRFNVIMTWGHIKQLSAVSLTKQEADEWAGLQTSIAEQVMA